MGFARGWGESEEFVFKEDGVWFEKMEAADGRWGRLQNNTKVHVTTELLLKKVEKVNLMVCVVY